jgi:hypothetical protein
MVVSVANDAEAEHLIREAGTRGYRPFMILEHDVTKRLATVRLQSKAGVLDVLFASSGIEPEVVAAAEMIELLPGVSAPVAGIPDLMALKLLARDKKLRPQDELDLHKLHAVATPKDFTRLHALVGLIEARGYHRNRDLGQLAKRYAHDGI